MTTYIPHLQQHLRPFFTLVTLCFGLVFTIPVSATQWDNELRCCFRPDDLKNQFVITLVTNQPVAHLRLTTPGGKRSGFQPATGKFYPPTQEMVYAQEPGTDWNLGDPEWNHFRNRFLVLRKRVKGDYTLEVIGQQRGKYFLSVYPAGFDRTRRSRSSAVAPADIQPGKIHIYTFPGEFADFLDNTVPHDSPERFRVKRIK
ncbi:MAG: hypothetical protein OEZ10_14110 [Gammaproteobacteria bacterium]|nr:hypothetical protein [Gammaproteobacteria bacterium]